MRELRLRAPFDSELAKTLCRFHPFAMVAETAPTPAKPPRISPGNRLPEATRLTVRSLYVVQGRNPKEIALALNLKPQQVRNLVVREGWTTLKAKRGESRSKQTEAKLLARADADMERVVEATAILSEDLQLRSLNLCGEYLDAKDAKSLQMASGAARNFVQIARMSRGLDSRGPANAAQPQGAGATLIFVGALERTTPKAEPKQVTEIIATAIPDAAPPSVPQN